MSLNIIRTYTDDKSIGNKKTKLQRLIYGMKLGIKLSLLPDSVNKIHNSPLIRIFRVLGGISILLVLAGHWLAKQTILFYIIFPLAFLQFSYILIINMIKSYYLYYLWKNNKLQVRNSPLDKIATFGLNLVACVKGTCIYGV